MFTKRLLLCAAVVATLGFSSCQQEEEITNKEEASQEVLAQIKALGFSNQNVQKTEGGYVVEGDIFLTENDLTGAHNTKALRVGESEQYRTTNLVNAGTGREITISMDASLPSSYVPALDEAIARYNAEGLTITMRRVSSGADISIVAAPRSARYLASAGFPTSAGDPHNLIKVATRYIGSNPNQAWFATILAHEVGHCIGFRHTDYMDRSYSCGGSYSNEGQSTVGAIHIPGTPTEADPNSWMLACIGSGQNRPFNSNDKVALGYLY
ncbi:M57 family metalloprotease [Pontibacter cellulosilyticus]|uniref:Protease n=1 Tax=Pontibacter cellulosilyticus TaxID=1720253 RepID=A0A923NBC2_9BACT|nr:M57 family metalloprotease [Pontibacter cellulosilyticus]MBC5993815.1 protease [Pontibacter cellulosilyticus]